MSESVPASNFIREIVLDDLRSGRHQQIVTRFPPEPNGFLHIGHAKAICLAFGLAEEFGGRCHLRMDDTNPLKEKEDYVQAMIRDIHWLGFDWGEHFYHASDYFDQLFLWAKDLVNRGLAYVDEQSEEQIRETRGTVETPGTPSPWRDRPAQESLDLLDKMAAGALPDGAMVLRARIDMAHPNMKMRDPLLYRIRNAPHHRTGDKWHIYPLYDWAHGQSDAIEGVTHSTCSLEFDVNRELYDWFIENLPVPARPRQYEFARLKIEGTMMSKRNLLALVEERIVGGWDDPRMPTLAGMRRRGITPSAIRTFVQRLGVSKSDSIVEATALDTVVRDDLNGTSPRVLVVLDPVELVMTDFPEGEIEIKDAPYFPPDIGKSGSRPLPLSRRVYIERADFEISPPKGYKRLAPGRTVRLRHGPTVTATGYEQDSSGNVTRILCARADSAAKVSATIHWVSADRAIDVEARLYEPLFLAAEPGRDRDFRADLNPTSLVVASAKGEPSLAAAAPGDRFQFERQGFFCVDPDAAAAGRIIVNRTVALKDSWAKVVAATEEKTEEIALPKQAPAQKKQKRALSAIGEALLASGLSEDEAGVLDADEQLRGWYEQARASSGLAPRAVAGWIVTELPRLAKERGGLGALLFTAGDVGKLAALVESKVVTGASAKILLESMAERGGSPEALLEALDLRAITDRSQIAAVIDETLATNPDKLAAYRGGRQGLFGFFLGQVVSKTRGRAEPQIAREILEERLKS